MKRKIHNEKLRKRIARRVRVRRRVARRDRPTLTVFRSARHIYAQLIDGVSGQTLVTVSSRSKNVMGDSAATGGVEAAKRVGKAIADQAREKQIEQVVFNRNGFLFHGRVKALAEAAREAGLRF
jgi:large subunit ribosomal protein L18